MSDQKVKLTYTNEAGDEVFTSTYLRNRGTCCKTNCLHCPYGFTLKNFPLEVLPMEEDHIKLANQIIKDSKPVPLSDLTLSILEAGYGKKERVTEYHVTLDNLSNFAFARLKGQICGVIEYSRKLSESASSRGIKELFLKKEFQDQGLGPEYIGA